MNVTTIPDEAARRPAITPATGTGKIYLPCVLAHAACPEGLSPRPSRLRDDLALALARADGSCPRLMNRLRKTRRLVLDDFGLAPLAEAQRRSDLLEDRDGRQATLVTSQLPLGHWHEAIGDATLAVAILDRLVHHGHRLALKELPCVEADRPTPHSNPRPQSSDTQRRFAPIPPWPHVSESVGDLLGPGGPISLGLGWADFVGIPTQREDISDSDRSWSD